MLDNFIFSINTTLPMVILVFAGIFFRKIGFINSVFLAGGNKIVFYVAMPILIFRSLASANLIDVLDLDFALFNAVFTVCAIFIIWGLSYLAFRKKAPGVISAFAQGSYRGNIGILALPVLLAIVAEENAAKGALVIAVLIPIYNILSVILLVVHSEKMSGLSLKPVLFGVIKNPPIIATIMGLAVAFSDIQLPIFAYTTVDQLAALATPLALICLGGGMVFEGFGSRFRYSVIASIIKIFLLPMAAGILAYLYGFRGDTLVTIIIMQGVPSAVISYVMVSQIGGDLYVAATNVLITTIMSAFSLTFLIFVMRTMGILV
ncbi:MAG: AEC family transporter [Defluviitaleaceae bacterium]|nr:AEC family transporter [Defluviitaleaceae bacterium]